MKTKKIPIRTCVVTKEKLPKQELIRIVNFNGTVIVDETGKKNGRGAYLKKDLEVFKKARQTKVLNHHLGINVSDDVYEELENLMK